MLRKFSVDLHRSKPLVRPKVPLAARAAASVHGATGDELQLTDLQGSQATLEALVRQAGFGGWWEGRGSNRKVDWNWNSDWEPTKSPPER